jgi:hypothetical protein
LLGDGEDGLADKVWGVTTDPGFTSRQKEKTNVMP